MNNDTPSVKDIFSSLLRLPSVGEGSFVIAFSIARTHAIADAAHFLGSKSNQKEPVAYEKGLTSAKDDLRAAGVPACEIEAASVLIHKLYVKYREERDE